MFPLHGPPTRVKSATVLLYAFLSNAMNAPEDRSPPSIWSPSIEMFLTFTPVTVAPVVGLTAVTRMMQPPHKSRLGGSDTISGCATQGLPAFAKPRENA